jgi:excisionase family DNA binding protein
MTNNESRKELLNTPQVAEWLNVKESTIRKWVHYGFIPHVKIGRCVRFMEQIFPRQIPGDGCKGLRWPGKREMLLRGCIHVSVS